MVQILSAVTADGKIIIPAQHPRTFLVEMKTNNKFSCIQCSEQVILKNGMIKTPHFAHTRNASCTQTFSEGESEDHLKGKLHLYEFLQKHASQVQLESYLPSLLQRPDLYVHSDPYPIAIEFQCSQIPVNAIQQRTIGYISKQIIPIWILRTPKISDFPVQEMGTMQLSAYRQQFFYTTPNGKIILTYCPQTKNFHYISNPVHIKGNNYIVKVKKLSMEKQTWPFAITKRISWEEFQKYFTIYKHHRFKQLDNLYFFNRRGIQSPFLQICYRWRIHPKKIPLFIGIPTKNASIFSLHAVEWQIQFIDYIHKLGLAIHQVDVQHCEWFLLYRKLSSNPSAEHIKAVESYLNILQHCLISTDQVIYASKINYSLMMRMLYGEFLAN
ncbi:competence protein CoiA [Psychrobacillus antarcticus]|uniref:competence protein CoiA n=1 Tax=Psychrobacillus antarcticus TaxID=2879115 RepID=UPI0024079F94|nr:competence protein CoiA family protein [Psychrobacillus antarcticus]